MSLSQAAGGEPEVKVPTGDFPSVEPEMESHLHVMQMLLLLGCLEYWWRDRSDFFASGNMTIYFSERQLKSEQFRGPDFFVVLGTDRRPRKSWVVWNEDGRYPNVIVEILSASTRAADVGLKKQVYQDVFRTPEYFLFDPETLEFAGFHLVDGVYQPLPPDAAGRLRSAQLGLLAGVHQGKMRFFTVEGELLPNALELGERAERAGERAEALARRLRELGVDPDTVR
jgi:Uma2 family endonuclease